MMLRADFGWIIFAVFAFWVLQVLRAGGRRSGRGGAAPPQRPSGPLEGTQQEGVVLEELLRQMEGRLGGGSGRRAEARPKVVVKRTDGAAVSHEAPREAPVDRNREVPEVARGAIGSGIHDEIGRPKRTPTVRLGLTSRQLRDAVVWREILGEPKGLQ
jgi:hypothetical protein